MIPSFYKNGHLPLVLTQNLARIPEVFAVLNFWFHCEKIQILTFSIKKKITMIFDQWFWLLILILMQGMLILFYELKIPLKCICEIRGNVTIIFEKRVVDLPRFHRSEAMYLSKHLVTNPTMAPLKVFLSNRYKAAKSRMLKKRTATIICSTNRHVRRWLDRVIVKVGFERFLKLNIELHWVLKGKVLKTRKVIDFCDHYLPCSFRTFPGGVLVIDEIEMDVFHDCQCFLCVVGDSIGRRLQKRKIRTDDVVDISVLDVQEFIDCVGNIDDRCLGVLGGGGDDGSKKQKITEEKAALNKLRRELKRLKQTPEQAAKVRRGNRERKASERGRKSTEEQETAKQNKRERQLHAREEKRARIIIQSGISDPITVQTTTQIAASIQEKMLVMRKVCVCCNRKVAHHECELINLSNCSHNDNLVLPKLRNVSRPPRVRYEEMLKQGLLAAPAEASVNESTGEIGYKEDAEIPKWVIDCPDVLIKFYSVADILDESWGNCLLSKHGILVVEDQKFIVLCRDCKSHMKKSKPFTPPKFAISNNLFIGAWPKELPLPNETEIACLRLYTPYIKINVLQKSRFTPQLHSSVTFFHSGQSVVGELNLVLPRALDNTSHPFQVVFETFKSPTEEDREYVRKNYVADPVVLRKLFQWLQASNAWYQQCEFDEDILGRIVELQQTDGVVVTFVEREAKAPAVAEMSTPIGPTSEDIIRRDVVANAAAGDKKIEKPQIEEISNVGSVYLYPPKGLDEKQDALNDAMQFADAHDTADIKSLKINNGTMRAFSKQPGVLEGSFFWMFPYGHGGLCVERQTAITTTEYFSSLVTLADGKFGESELIHSFSAECLRYEAASKKIHSLRNKHVDGLLTISVEQLGDAMKARLEESCKYDDNKSAPLNGNAKTVLEAINHMFSGVPGSKESKLQDRLKLSALITEFGMPHIFATFNPSKRDQILYYYHATGTVTSEPFPSQREIMKTIGKDIEAHAFSFCEAVRIFKSEVLGFNEETGKFSGGLFGGKVKSFFIVPEATQQGYLHAHCLIWLDGMPRGPADLQTMCENGDEQAVMEKISKFGESLILSCFPDYFDYNPAMVCPRCKAPTKPLDLPKRYRLRPEYHYGPANVVGCSSSTCDWGMTAEKHVRDESYRVLLHYGQMNCATDLDTQFQAMVNKGELATITSDDALVLSDSRCNNYMGFQKLQREQIATNRILARLATPVNEQQDDADCKIKDYINASGAFWETINLEARGDIDALRQSELTIREREAILLQASNRLIASAKFGLLLLSVQHHKTSHTDTCFKKGCMCRMNHPREVVETTEMKECLEVRRSRFSEFLNSCLECVTRGFQCNSDVRLLPSRSSPGLVLLFYTTKYCVKEQDLFARGNINVILTKFLELYKNSRDRKTQEAEATITEETEELDNKTKRGIARSLASTVFNAFRKAEALDLTMCALWLKTDGKEYWSSHKFVNLSYRRIVDKVFGKSPSTTALFYEDETAPVEEKFMQKDQHAQYLARPEAYLNTSFYDFTKVGMLKRKGKAKIKESEKFLEDSPFAKSYYYMRLKNPQDRCVTLSGYSFPSHFNFEQNPMVILKGSVDVVNETQQQEQVLGLVPLDSFVDDYDDDNVQGLDDDDDDEALGQEAVRDVEADKDQRLQFRTIEEKQNLWGLLACLLYVPHRSLDELKPINESWWEAFKRVGPTLSEAAKLQLISIMEMKPCPEARRKDKELRLANQNAAQQDACLARGDAKNKGWSYKRDNSDDDEFIPDAKRIDILKAMLREEEQLDKCKEISKLWVNPTTGDSRMVVNTIEASSPNAIEYTSLSSVHFSKNFIASVRQTLGYDNNSPTVPVVDDDEVHAEEPLIDTSNQNITGKPMSIEVNGPQAIPFNMDAIIKKYNLNDMQGKAFVMYANCILRSKSLLRPTGTTPPVNPSRRTICTASRSITRRRRNWEKPCN